jgi:hypothetical protein
MDHVVNPLPETIAAIAHLSNIYVMREFGKIVEARQDKIHAILVCLKKLIPIFATKKRSQQTPSI